MSVEYSKIITKRNGSVELLRIICMFMIVFLHVGTFGLQKYVNNMNVYNQLIYNFFRFISIISVNVFFIISGFFQYNKKGGFNKNIKIALKVSYFSIAIFVVSLLLFDIKINFDIILKSLFPIFFDQYWFITIYILLSLLSPYLNIVIEQINQIEFKKILVGLFLVCNIWQFIQPINGIGVNLGQGILYTSYLYLLGAYLNKYSISFFKINHMHFIMYLVLSTLLSLVQTLVLHNSFERLFAYNSPVALFQSLLLMIFFKNINYSQDIINRTAKYMLGIYLVHNNNVLKQYIWNWIPFEEISQNIFVVFYMFLIAICIFCVSLLISYILELSFTFIYQIIMPPK